MREVIGKCNSLFTVISLCVISGNWTITIKQNVPFHGRIHPEKFKLDQIQNCFTSKQIYQLLFRAEQLIAFLSHHNYVGSIQLRVGEYCFTLLSAHIFSMVFLSTSLTHLQRVQNIATCILEKRKKYMITSFLYSEAYIAFLLKVVLSSDFLLCVINGMASPYINYKYPVLLISPRSEVC